VTLLRRGPDVFSAGSIESSETAGRLPARSRRVRDPMARELRRERRLPGFGRAGRTPPPA